MRGHVCVFSVSQETGDGAETFEAEARGAGWVGNTGEGLQPIFWGWVGGGVGLSLCFLVGTCIAAATAVESVVL